MTTHSVECTADAVLKAADMSVAQLFGPYNGHLKAGGQPWTPQEMAESIFLLLDPDPEKSALAINALTDRLNRSSLLARSLQSLLKSLVLDPAVREAAHLPAWDRQGFTCFYETLRVINREESAEIR